MAPGNARMVLDGGGQMTDDGGRMTDVGWWRTDDGGRWAVFFLPRRGIPPVDPNKYYFPKTPEGSPINHSIFDIGSN
ncbi:MAG: hypothetical protein B7Z54_04130 [Sphingobacteriales bacterium 12-47-4]|nr:MAG: hypothetical protein B7Z54_04130 [Sphingobacteriales bacterium 12-47-4]